MRRFIIFTFLFFLVLRFVAQTQTYSVSLYFAINESSSAFNFARIDSLLRAIGTEAKQIKLHAYADFLSDPSYNLRLSQMRLDGIKNYIQSKEAKNTLFQETKAYGEEYSKDDLSTTGEPSQRRVDVIITVQVQRKKISPNKSETQTQQEKPLKKLQSTKVVDDGKKDITDLEKGESLAIEGLSFIPGRHILMKTSYPVLEELLNTLKANPELKIEIQGHICCLSYAEEDGLDLDTGEPELSKNRALAVYNYLLKNGIEKERLTYKGYGHKNPKIKNEQSPEDEQVNRRVEIKILEN